MVTFHSEDIGNTFGSKGFAGFEPASLIVEADEPNAVIPLFDAGALAGEQTTNEAFVRDRGKPGSRVIAGSHCRGGGAICSFDA
jgi:hypothetical protein